MPWTAALTAGGTGPGRASGLALALLICICGCSSAPHLVAPPAAFDLTGEWKLVDDESEAPPAPGRFDDSRRGALRALARGGASRDFPVIATKTMRIEQNADSMGIRYDNGEYRDISWGQRERGMWTVQAGWSDGSLYIISKAHDSEASEEMKLAPDGDTLTVGVEVAAGRKFTVTRVFRRVSASAP